MQGNLLVVLEPTMMAAIAQAKEKLKAAAATSSTSDLAEVLDTFLLCMDQMYDVLTGGAINDRSKHQRLREEKAAMELQSDMLAALSELEHYKGSLKWPLQTSLIREFGSARPPRTTGCAYAARLEANAASVNLHFGGGCHGNATFTPAELQAHPSVVQVNVTRNGFELSPCIGRCAHAPVPGVRAAISHSAVTRGMTGLRSAVALRADLANAAAKAAN